MRDDAFWAEQREQSKAKAAIVHKYFVVWANVIIGHLEKDPNASDTIAYVDLFAGRGRYEDGTPSTPLLVLKAIIENEKRALWVVPIFNDADPDKCRDLKDAVKALPGLEALQHQPQFSCLEVGPALSGWLGARALPPSLFFIDPYGYKGVSISLIGSAIKDWGSECILFLNMNRIVPAIWNEVVEEHMQELFGVERLPALRARLMEVRTAQARQLVILEELSAALEQAGAHYVLPFGFTDDRGNRTLHYLVHITKNILGYEIMKDVMARESSSDAQGVASFAYSPADKRFPRLFELARPLDDLEEMLLDEFAAQTLTMKQIYQRHHVGRPYVKRNYKETLRKLEAAGKISCEPPADQRQVRDGQVTLADRVKVTFPPRTE